MLRSVGARVTGLRLASFVKHQYHCHNLLNDFAIVDSEIQLSRPATLKDACVDVHQDVLSSYHIGVESVTSIGCAPTCSCEHRKL